MPRKIYVLLGLLIARYLRPRTRVKLDRVPPVRPNLVERLCQVGF